MKSVLLLFAVLSYATAQEVHILVASPLNTVYGSEEAIICVAFIPIGEARVLWSSTAENASLSNVSEVINEDFPATVDIVTLSIMPDSEYCGEYTCTEETLSSNVTASIQVDVAPDIAEHPENTSIGASRLAIDSVTFTCTVQGGPGLPVRTVWRSPSVVQQALSTPTNIVLPNGDVLSTLTISGVTFDHVGEYWCVTEYTDTDCTISSESNTGVLFIVEAPEIITEPDPTQQNVSVGSSLSYMCSFNASNNSSRLSFQPELANFSVFWIGPLGQIENSSSYAVQLSMDEDIVNTTLLLSNVSSSEGGIYTCVSENIDGSVNGSALLFVDPVIEPTNYTTSINQTLNIVCNVQDFPVPSFRWQKEMNGSYVNLPALILTNGRELNTTLKNLTFDPVLFGDEGIYRCVVYTAEFGSVLSNNVLVTVSPEEGVTVSPVDQIFNNSDNLTLECMALGGPGNQFNWTVKQNDLTIQGPLSPTFELSPVQGGVYTCVVSNTAGFGEATTTVFISLKFLKHPNDTNTDVQMRVVLSCEAESFPDPTYEWLRVADLIREDLQGINSSTLVIDPVHFGDEGEYYCLAMSRTNFTLPSRTATLTVSPRGKVSIHPLTQVANVSTDVDFTCSSQGGPNNTYQWYKDQQLLPDETNETIAISNITFTDGGEYTCIVSNAAGNDNDTATLYVRPYIVVYPELDVRARDGDSVNLTCIAEGFPEPSIAWEKINGTERIFVDSGETLRFDPVAFGDEGMYVCVASSSVPDQINMTQAPAVLTVSPEGSVTVDPVDQIFYFEDNVTITCSFLGGLNNTLTWAKDGLDLPGESNPELLLLAIEAQDGGVYTCTVSNSAGNESASTTLFVAPYFVVDPVDVLANNGQNVSFDCLAESFPMATYSWVRASNQTIRSEAIGQNESSLFYLPARFGDEGVYYCEATILNVTVPSEVATLTLAPDGVNVTAFPLDEISFGQSVDLSCQNFGGPSNAYIWLKDGVPLDNQTSPILLLTEVEALDGGVYTCVVVNLAGNTSSDIVLYVHPHITLLPSSLVTVENGSFTNFSCEADGFPAPNITWIKYESFENRSNFAFITTGEELPFDPVLFGDEGYYGCVATAVRFDGAGQLITAMSDPPSELAVSPTPTVSIAEHNVTYSLGDNTTLTCSALGGPNNSYVWLHNTDVIGLGPNLTLSEINAMDGGEYTCIVSNNAGNDTDSTNVYVHPYFIREPELNVFTMDGEFVNIECIVDGFPAPNVTWRNLGLEIGGSNSSSGSGMDVVGMRELAMFDNLPLEFSPVAFGDEGFYRCIVSAQTSDGVVLETVMSEPSLITVSPEGSVQVDPIFQTLERFSNTTLTCSSLGGPNNTYQWLKNDDELFGENTTSLTLFNVLAMDGGVYSCTVSNAAGNETVDADVFIEPYIIENPTADMLSLAGENVSFECVAESFPHPSYIWEKVSENFTAVSDTRILEFFPVMFGDEGVYRCVAYISANGDNITAASESGLLTVSPKGGVSSSPPIHNSTRNETVSFLCLSLGGPGNTFSWTRVLGQTLLSNSSLLEVFVEGEFSGGVYRCDVDNRAGNGSFKAVLNVVPVITEHPQGLNVTLEHSFSLSCGANGYPIPEIVWLLNGSEIDINTTLFQNSGSGSGGLPIQVEEVYGVRSVQSTLTVSMAMTNDSGNYSCLVVSPVQEFTDIETQLATVLVQDVPDPPHSVFSQSVTNTSIILVWSQPHDNNAPILSYEITFNQPLFFGGGEERVNSSVEMRFISGLHPGTVYNFTTVAVNEIGLSDPSNPTPLSTLDEEPESPPLNLTSAVLNSTSVFLSWIELPEIDRNGLITTYEVQFTPLIECPFILPGSRNGSGTYPELVVGGLEENTAYNFSVRAYTSAGPGPYGDIISSTTFKDIPSAPPNNIIITPLSSTELHVQWDPIDCQDQNGIVALYKVFYRTPNNFSGLINSTYSLTTPNRSAVLRGLEENNVYEVLIRGYTSVGPGPYSSPQSNRTLEDVPSAAPLNVQVITLSSTELSVTWNEVPPIHQNGLITQYEVLYKPLNTFGGLIVSNSTLVLAQTTVLTGLQEDIEYNVSVRAYTSIGPGPYSNPESSTTSMDVPSGPPTDVSVFSVVSPTNLMVRWNLVPEIDRNGEIVLYEVLYSPLDTFNGQLNDSYSVTTNETSVLLVDLQEFLQYNVSVRAYTVIGPGVYSTSVTGLTSETSPSGPVQNVTAMPSSSTTITIQWDEVAPIDQNGVQTEYEVRFEPVTSFVGFVLQGGSALTNTSGLFVLVGLQEFVEYNVSVRAYTAVGPGPFSTGVEATTQQDEPSSPPTNILVSVLSPTKLVAWWNEVREIDQNGVITEYQVVYRPFTTFNGRIPSVQTVNVSADSVNTTLSDLEEFVQYSVSVSAATVVGFGPFSQELNVTTPPDLPASSPVNVNVSATSPTQLFITWEPPDPLDQNGLILSYTLVVMQSTFPDIDSTLNYSVQAPLNQLAVSGLEEDVVYSVRVLAVNEAGESPYSEPVQRRTPEDSPSAPPGNLRGFSPGPNTLVISWDHPPEIHQNGELTLYTVIYSIIGSDNVTLVNVSGLSLGFRLEELNNYTVYSVSVAAETREGQGPPDVLYVRTQQNVPGKPPIVTELRGNSFESILIEWEPPEADFIFGILQGYTIRYLNSDLPGEGYTLITGEISNASSYHIIEGLLQFTNYTVQIAAVTIGEGVFSDPMIVRTDQDRPGAAPEDIQLVPQPSNPRTLLVMWGEVPRPLRNGIIIRYDIRFQPLETYGGQIFTSIEDSAEMMVVLEGLEEDTPYNVSVRAYTTVGEGPYSEEFTVRTAEGAPSAPPGGLTADEERLFSRNMTVQWSSVPPISQNGEIIHYTVKYRAVDESIDILNSTEEMEFLATVLIPGTVYSVEVAASTSPGMGVFSPAIFVTTREEPPGPVGAITIVERFTSITLQWDEPSEPNGVLIIYEVMFNTSLSEPPKYENVSVPAAMINVVGLTTGQDVAFQVRAYTRKGPSPYMPVQATTRNKPPKILNVNVEADPSDPDIAIVQWTNLTGVDAENIVEYIISYSDSETTTVVRVGANVSRWIIEGLNSDTDYLFQVAAVARIDNDTIEGDLSDRNIGAFHSIPPTELFDPVPGIQLGSSITVTFIITVLVCVIIFVIIVILLLKWYKKKRPPAHHHHLQPDDGHYESVEMLRRQMPLPAVPPTQSGRSTPRSVHMNQSYRAFRRQDTADDIYDNDPPPQPGNDRYSTVPITPTSSIRRPKSTRVEPPKGTVIENQETYEAVIDDEEVDTQVQEVYDNDPFETTGLEFRRDSNPNIYSEVRGQDKPMSEAKSDVPGKSVSKSSIKPAKQLDTSMVLTNPAAEPEEAPTEPQAYEVPPKKPTSKDEADGSESGEEYEDMTDIKSTLSAISQSFAFESGELTSSEKAATDEGGTKAETAESTTETVQSNTPGEGDDDAQNESETVAKEPPGGLGSYFLFEDHYDDMDKIDQALKAVK